VFCLFDLIETQMELKLTFWYLTDVDRIINPELQQAKVGIRKFWKLGLEKNNLEFLRVMLTIQRTKRAIFKLKREARFQPYNKSLGKGDW
jgi:hypothetical protein